MSWGDKFLSRCDDWLHTLRLIPILFWKMCIFILVMIELSLENITPFENVWMRILLFLLIAWWMYNDIRPYLNIMPIANQNQDFDVLDNIVAVQDFDDLNMEEDFDDQKFKFN
jgi:hypothetical protein